MRIQVILDSSVGALTVHAEGYSTATPPARLAATLASIVEAALTEPAPSVQPPPVAQRLPVDHPPVDHPLVDTARPTAPAADQQSAPALTTRPTVEAPAVPPAATTLVAAKAPAAEVVVAPDVPANDGRDEQLRRTAVQLLDDGVTDDQVCAQLGISRSRLLRWDDPDGEFLAPSTGTLAAVGA